ncbi:uncharacterized protein Hap1MRO34_000207 [Clarias gariepinus]
MMIRFIRLVLKAVEMILRPLQYAAGAAVTAGEGTPEREDTDTTQDSEQKASTDVSSLDSSSVSDVAGVTHTDSTTLEGEAERRFEKAMEIIYEMEKKNNNLKPNVITLQEELTLSFRMCKELMREKEREQEAQHILESQCKEMKEILQQRDEFLKVEAERKHQEVSQLESEKSELMSEMKTLRGSVQHKEEELSLTRTRFQEMSMKLSEARRKYDKAVVFLAKIETERCAMKYHVNYLRGTVRELEEMLSDSESKRDALKQEKEQEHQTHSMLKVSLAELTMENQALLATNAELRTEQTDLRAEVNRLHAVVHDQETELTETTRKCNKMTLECEQKDQELKSMEIRWDMMLKEKEQEQQAHSSLKMEHGVVTERLAQCIELLKVHGIDPEYEEYKTP